MGIIVIREGDKIKQGNAICPQCGKIILIKNYYGDPPYCEECNTPYKPIIKPIRWE